MAKSSDGEAALLCWGNTRSGELGLGGIEEEVIDLPTANRYFTRLLSDGGAPKRLVQVAAGYSHTLYLLADGSVYSSGNNDYEQLGHEGPRKRPELVDGLNEHVMVAVATGRSFSLALSNKGELFCWGSIDEQRDSEQLFYAKPSQLEIPSVDSAIVQIACGYYHLMMLTEDGKVYVMGLNSCGQLGQGDHKPLHTPVYLRSLQGVPVRQIACGAYHSMVLSVSGAVFAFGKNEFGQLGLGDTDAHVYPLNLKVLSTMHVCYVACGEDFTAVLTLDGGVFTFGAGMFGQLGHNNISNEYLPLKVADLMGSEVTQIACGRCHTLVYLAASGRLYAFGLNGNGQLGIGASVHHTATPTPVQYLSKGKTNPIVISAGGDQSFLTFMSNEQRSPDFRQIVTQHQILTVDDELSADASNTIVPRQPTHLTKLVSTVFASSASLNASFLNQNAHYDTSTKYPGVDLEKARDAFRRLSRLNDPKLNELVLKQLTLLYNYLPDSPPSIEALRLYVTTPYFLLDALLKDPLKLKSDEMPMYHLFLYAYAQSVTRLKKTSAGRVLDYWFAWAGEEFFKNLITVYKAIIVYIIDLSAANTDGQQVTENELLFRQSMLKTAMELLQKLHKINLEKHEIVPYDTFYIPEIVDRIDIKHDYLEWLQRKNLRPDHVLFCDYPFVFDARVKTLLLQTDADIQRQLALQEAWQTNITSIFSTSVDPVNPLLTLFIRREHVVVDTLNQLSKQRREDLKKPLKVMFIGEDAYDAGGVKKEFFMLLLRDILDLKYGMFTFYEETNHIWFNDQTLEGSDMYHLIGVVMGLAIYNSIIIDLPFPLALYKKLLNELPIDLKDMYTLSPSVAKGFEDLLNYTEDDFTSVFGLTFEITRQRFDQTLNIELIPDGAKIPVTRENVRKYVESYIDYIFNSSVKPHFDAFSEGFHHVCGSKVLQLFHASELMAMVIGNQNYDFDELQRCAEYKGDFNATHPVIVWFWEVFHELSLEEKKKFLIFLTGTDRIPILGMKRVKITIQSTSGGDAYFPVAHTCFNLLDLPQYSTREILHQRLLTSIEHTQGFTIV